MGDVPRRLSRSTAGGMDVRLPKEAPLLVFSSPAETVAWRGVPCCSAHCCWNWLMKTGRDNLRFVLRVARNLVSFFSTFSIIRGIEGDVLLSGVGLQGGVA